MEYIREEILESAAKPVTDTKYLKGIDRENFQKARPLSEIEAGTVVRYHIMDPELNRVLGGGLVPGSLVLLGGQPGIGKSTLLLQVAAELKRKVLYVSGEESASQIKMRADRLEIDGSHCLILNETVVEKILKTAVEVDPDLIIIDSIQTLSSTRLESTAGTISQIRECTAELQAFAKQKEVPVILIGHINKEGSIAGPKVLEHVVDAVLYFEGERSLTYRILRTHKNRFGSTDEIGIYEMMGEGLRPVTNPSEILLSQNEDQLSGSAVAAMLEGQRPMMIEAQALVSTAIYGTAQRSSTGFDMRRLSMLLAVLEKRCGYFFGKYDVFLNIAGGLKVVDTGIDLAVAAALISSLQDSHLSNDICFAGEIGLSGEIRAVTRINRRISEAEKLGFKSIVIPKINLKSLSTSKYKIDIIGVGKLRELRDLLFSDG